MLRHAFALVFLAPATIAVTSALVAIDIAHTFIELARADRSGLWR